MNKGPIIGYSAQRARCSRTGISSQDPISIVYCASFIFNLIKEKGNIIQVTTHRYVATFSDECGNAPEEV
jgi:hypothetical protein